MAASASSGDESPPPLDSAELYDPATGTFVATGAMAGPRALHSASLLADGTVLLAGGTDGEAVLASAEHYDPATGTFALAGTMTSPRALHTATRLDDGSLLLVGGLVEGVGDEESQVAATMERYDPATGTFIAVGAMAAARGGHTATLLDDGRILVTGGLDADGDALASAELVDPATGEVTPAGGMTKPRALHSAILLADGDVLIVGGEGEGAPGSDVDLIGAPEIYDVTTGTFRPVAP